MQEDEESNKKSSVSQLIDCSPRRKEINNIKRKITEK